MELERVEIQLKSLPEVAGVYQYFDNTDKMPYVGKAKNLKKRVNSISLKPMLIEELLYWSSKFTV